MSEVYTGLLLRSRLGTRAEVLRSLKHCGYRAKDIHAIDCLVRKKKKKKKEA